MSEQIGKAQSEGRQTTELPTNVTAKGGRQVDNKNLGKVLQRKDDPAEPVMAPVAEKDKEVGGIAVDRLRSLIERIERLTEEKKSLQNSITYVFAEAKAGGFDVKIMRAIIKLRATDAATRDEWDYLLETYRKALDL